jgi:hypothetical protein
VSGRFSTTELRYRTDEHPDQAHFTPQYVLEPVRTDLGGVIDLDPCTVKTNPTGAESFYSLPDDGCVLPWAGSVFVNPPYGQAKDRWLRRCAEVSSNQEDIRVIALVPSATDTRVFHEVCATTTAVVFVTGRLKFGVKRPNGRQRAASHPSVLLGWGTDLVACADLGRRCRFEKEETP